MKPQHYLFAILLGAGAVFADDKPVTFTTLSMRATRSPSRRSLSPSR